MTAGVYETDPMKTIGMSPFCCRPDPTHGSPERREP
jgi:hypothetical protein